ncbi:hypothetical protein GOODEAATRI_014704, partial [Goodea atripinnis]
FTSTHSKHFRHRLQVFNLTEFVVTLMLACSFPLKPVLIFVWTQCSVRICSCRQVSTIWASLSPLEESTLVRRFENNPETNKAQAGNELEGTGTSLSTIKPVLLSL